MSFMGLVSKAFSTITPEFPFDTWDLGGEVVIKL